MISKISAPSYGKKTFDLNSALLGTVLAVIVAALLIVLGGTTLYFSPATEKWIPAVGLLIFFLSIFSGSFFAAKKAGTKGLFHGLGVGMMFFLICILLGVFMDADILGLAFGKKFVITLLAGSLGGIWGVGSKK